MKPRERHINRDGINFIIRYMPCNQSNVIISTLINFGKPQFLHLFSKDERRAFLKSLNLPKNFIFSDDYYEVNNE